MKINIRNHINPHIPTLILLVIGLVLLYYLEFDKYMIQVFLAIWALDILPSLYIHFEYWLKNRGEEFEVHSDILIRYKNGRKESYNEIDIEKIVIYLSPALYRRSDLHFLGIEAFHYARVYLKSGEELIMTCLLTPKVEEALMSLKGVKIHRKKQLFNFLATR